MAFGGIVSPVSGGTTIVPSAAEAAGPGEFENDDKWLFERLLAIGAAENDTTWELGEPNEYPGDKVLQAVQRADAALVATLDHESKYKLRLRHVQICEWLSRHQSSHHELREKLMRRAVGRLMLWSSQWQWTEAFHEDLGASAAPWFPEDSLRKIWPSLAQAVASLQASIVPIFVDEYLRAASRSSAHPEGLHVTGTWTVLFIWEYEESCKHNLFPRSCVVLQNFDKAIRAVGQGKIKSARFATLHPGTKVVTHTAPANDRLKVHCGLENPDSVSLRIANLSLIWRPGQCIVIDDSFEHEIESRPDQHARTILELKVQHPDLKASGYFIDEETGKKIYSEKGQSHADEL